MMIPTSGKGLLIAIGVVAAILLWPFVHMVLSWGIGVGIIAAVLYIAYVVGARAHRWAIGA
jgi:hypothetical protein